MGILAGISSPLRYAVLYTFAGRISCLLALCCAFWAPVLLAAAAPGAESGTVVVPDRFLRRWDPVTIFFDRDLGPAGGGPEDHPQRYATLIPAHPGAYAWLDAHTLQFRPVEPWPPLARFEWRAGERSVILHTLMAAPLSTLPEDGAEGLDPVQSLTLSFAEPLAVEHLAQMIRIELRPLPGVKEARARTLRPEEYVIKPLDRKSREDPASYVLRFKEAVPANTRVGVNLRLSLDADEDVAFERIVFATAEAFRITRLGCGDAQYPVTPAGVAYSREQAIACDPEKREVRLRFSAPPRALGPVEGRNLVRFTPPVDGLAFTAVDDVLRVEGEFRSDTLYQVDLAPILLQDVKGRDLQMSGGSRLFLYFPAQARFLNWKIGQGIVERFGPQMLSMEGRGFGRLDLRIYSIDPLNRSLWPFPERPVRVDEDQRPPAPGEEPAAFTRPDRTISSDQLARQIHALGSPGVSILQDLPLNAEKAANFGLDLESHLEKLRGEGAPGTYLVGARTLDGAPERAWVRVQVTDLSLSTVEEPDRVRFVVSSLKSAAPVPGAEVRVEGSRQQGREFEWVTLFSGRTDHAGLLEWRAPGTGDWRRHQQVRRISVRSGGDILVLNPNRAPERFADNHWASSHDTWLQWTQQDLQERFEPPRILCHLFTERPVIRPEEPVHIKGYIRERALGRLKKVLGNGFLVVEGPGDRQWRYPLAITEAGSFYHLFDEKDLPTGEYRAYFEYNQKACGSVRFKKEAYRLPRFEVRLHGPDTVPSDGDFQVGLTATYYAGGPVAERPVRWRVTQFPYAWSPSQREGFLFSSDARFSGQGEFRSVPALQEEGLTDADGMAAISLAPSAEPDGRPRRYVIEATVTGAGDQTVTDTHEVLSLPPFTLGLKVPRYLPKAERIEPEFIAVDPKGELLPGMAVTVRLFHRQWHSYLQAGDFSQGVAKYVTDRVDEKVFETTVASGAEPTPVSMPIDRAGVYIVELESRDKLGRAQSVRVDLYAGGGEPVTWARPPSRVFKVTTDKDRYAPGETARLVLESPFQEARALAVVEAPDGNRYEWVEIRGGAASFEVPIQKSYAPRLPVHFILMRGRLENSQAPSAGGLDLGKPATLAATAWVQVEPVKQRLKVDLAYPQKAQPGEEIEVTLSVTDDEGHPLGGEATLWLVDQAVLALGEEQRLDPLPDFITARASRVQIRDTRNLALGFLPYEEQPGGGQGGRERSELIDRVTVRKQFVPVPYYNPALQVGPGGRVSVKIQLPDNLTNFKLRAKVASGDDRFGFATGRIAVRLPVIVQPSLPRFVRPGDAFTAVAIGRIVEGESGPGVAEIRLEGANLEDRARKPIDWRAGEPQRIEYRVAVPTPVYTAAGEPEREAVRVTLAVERTTDQARDAFQVDLPIRPDRAPVIRRVLEDLGATKIQLPAVEEPFRRGTLQRSLLLSDRLGLVRMAAGLDYLLGYPHGCTEQRISRARALIASGQFREALGSSETDVAAAFQSAQEWISQALDENGLVAAWPGSRGFVHLTAWSALLLAEARDAGLTVDAGLFGRLLRSLNQSLRSDYARFIDGEAYAERVWALSALAAAGNLDPAYAAELARKAEYSNLESLAQVVRVLGYAGAGSEAMLQSLRQRLWDGVVVQLYQGREVYGGLKTTAGARNPLILPSEVRTLAEILRATIEVAPQEPKTQLLIDALVNLGRDDGWGDTNTNAAALLALSQTLKAGSGRNLQINVADKTVILDRPVVRVPLNTAGAIAVGPAAAPVVLRAETRYLPVADGSRVEAEAQGFVVRRELQRIVGEGVPPQRYPLEKAGSTLAFGVGDVIEEHVELVNPEDRTYVAIVVPLAAGMEPLNPALATAPPEAKPSGSLTSSPVYTAFLDDKIAYYYNTLSKGTYHFYFRTRAAVPGEFIQPAAFAEKMYDQAVRGNGFGAKVVIAPK